MPGQGTTPTNGAGHRSGRSSAATAPPKAAASASSPSPVLTAAEAGEAAEPVPPTEAAANPAATAGTEATQTEILASAGATFASKDRIAVFNGDVRVHDPKFQLACDKLTVFLNKAADKGASAAATPAATTPSPLAGSAPPAPGDKAASSGGIDHAYAEGHVIVIQERAATPGGEAKRSVGRADWASFDNKTGDMVLKGTPSVEQNGNTHVATSPDTVMTLRRDNSLLTVGPSRTLITQRHKDEVPGAPGTGRQAASPSPANERGAR